MDLFSFSLLKDIIWLVDSMHYIVKIWCQKNQRSASLSEVSKFRSRKRNLQNPKSRLVHDPGCAILTAFRSSDSPAMEALALLWPQLKAQRIIQYSEVFEKQYPHVRLRSSWSQSQRLSQVLILAISFCLPTHPEPQATACSTLSTKNMAQSKKGNMRFAYCFCEICNVVCCRRV